MSRLVVVSNRVALPRDRSARAGGLAVGVLSALKRARGLWLGWSGETTETPDSQPRVVKSGGSSEQTMSQLLESSDATVREAAVRGLVGQNSMNPWPWPQPRPRPMP